MSRKFTLRGRLAAAAAVAVTALATAFPAPAQAQNQYQTFDSTVGIFNCSASVVKMPGARDSDRALILTNGHCIEPVFDRYLRRGEVVTNHSLFFLSKPYFKEVTFYGGNEPTELLKGKLTHVVYATMDNTDIAILKSNKTYAQLQRSGVKVRNLSTSRPQQGLDIQIPSTYWKGSYSCGIDGFAHELHEGTWLWRDAIRYTESGCRVQSGSSGSPIVDISTGDVVGVNNTGNDGGSQCSLGSPCEVDAYGNKTSYVGRGYGTQTYYIPTCFNGSNLAMGKGGCELPKR